MVDFNNRYGSNRNLWRKVYSFGVRREPQTITVTVPETGLSYSMDRQTTARHRDYYKIIQSGSSIGAPIHIVQYDEGLIHFNNETSVTFNFNFAFLLTPYTVFTIETPGSTNTENINIYGTFIGLTTAGVGTSAPYSGSIRYRAVRSTMIPEYPVTCSNSFTASFICSAGAYTPANATFYTASYASLDTVPTLFLQSPFDTLNLGDADVYLSASTSTATETPVDISAPMSSPIHFIVYQ